MQRNGKALVVLLGLMVVLMACAPAAAPTPTPTKAPAAAPTKAAEPTKPPAPAATPSPAPVATPSPKPVTLKFGDVGSIGAVGAYVAMEKGYFREQGIDVELVKFGSTSEAIPMLGTGQLDFSTTTLSVSLLAAADRGIQLKIVSDMSQSRPNWEMIWIALRKDLAESGKVKKATDLKGMKVSITSLGSIADQTVQKMLAKEGVTSNDVETVVIPFADTPAAMTNKTIAASYVMDPQLSQIVQGGYAVKWMPLSSFYGGTAQVGLVAFGANLLKDQDLARRFMMAYLKGVRDYLKAVPTKEGREQVVDVLTKYTAVKDRKAYDVMELPYLDPNGQLDRKSMDEQFQWMVDKGLYKGKMALNEIIDLSYAEYASQKLGKQ